MKRILLLSALFALALSKNAMSCTEDGKEGILPKNDLKISVNSIRSNGMTEEIFNRVVDETSKLMEPFVTLAGGELQVIKNWHDETVNAYATRSGNYWAINMFGGLARHDTITKDGLALVVCHEIGHHIGGAPKKNYWWSSQTHWASNEGQADYFATLKCLRRLFADDNNAEIIAKADIPEIVSTQCQSTYKTKREQDLCIRTTMAGHSVAKLFESFDEDVTIDFSTPDENIVGTTYHNHPEAQCRLDTYFAGSLCTVALDDAVDQEDELKGVCTRSNNFLKGNRPLCWYKPSSEDDDEEEESEEEN